MVGLFFIPLRGGMPLPSQRIYDDFTSDLKLDAKLVTEAGQMPSNRKRSTGQMARSAVPCRDAERLRDVFDFVLYVQKSIPSSTKMGLSQ